LLKKLLALHPMPDIKTKDETPNNIALLIIFKSSKSKPQKIRTNKKIIIPVIPTVSKNFSSLF
jgi:hypothetical protein